MLIILTMPSDLSPLWISLKTAALATVITFFVGISTAYWMLGYRGKAKSLIEGIFIAPLILPPTVVGFLLLLFFGVNEPGGKFLKSGNFSIVFTWYGAAIAATVVSFPLMYKTALGAFEQIDRNLLWVARTLGASETRIFWQISLPLALPGIIAGTTLTFARALGEFGATLMLAGNIPKQTQTMPMAIYFAVEAGDMNEAWFWTISMMGISLLAIIAVNFWQEKREMQRKRREYKKDGKSSLIYHPLPLTNTGLMVDIQKKLPDFELKVSFNSQQEPLGLLGGSGAGKSMILRCVAGIETPTSGKIVLNGRVLFDSERKINLPACDRHIGFLFQNYALFPHLTVAENIAFGLPKGLSASSIQVQIQAQLLNLQLQGYGDRYPHQLSGGQQQRVALARALASLPEALLLDEPFSALDSHLRSQLEQQMIVTLNNYAGFTLFVTHNLEEAYRICPQLLVLEQGKSVHYGSKQEVFERPATFTVAQLTGCKNFSPALAKSSSEVEAIDWECTLQVKEPIPELLSYIGIRAHQISFTNDPNQNNTFPCWLVNTLETPHRMTLFLKLHFPPENRQDYHLQAEVFKEKWVTLKEKSFPWYVSLDPQRLILMKD